MKPPDQSHPPDLCGFRRNVRRADLGRVNLWPGYPNPVEHVDSKEDTGTHSPEYALSGPPLTVEPDQVRNGTYRPGRMKNTVA